METFYRAIIIFIAGYFLLRASGKKAVAQMNTFDLLYILVLTNVISEPIEVKNIGRALIYAVIMLILYKILLRMSLHNKLRWILYENPTVLIQNGYIDKKGLKQVRMPMNELLSQLRVKGYTDTKNIAMAVMEQTGNLSVIPKSEYRPVQPRDLNISVTRAYLPIPLIMDGQIVYHNLNYLQLDERWLNTELEKAGEQVGNVILATYLENGELFIDHNKIPKQKGDPYYYKPGRDN